MLSEALLTMAQIFALFVVVLIGIVLLSTMFLLFTRTPAGPKQRWTVALGWGVLSSVLLLDILLGVGIGLWLDSGKFRAGFSLLPLGLCVLPFMFAITTLGTYYRL